MEASAAIFYCSSTYLSWNEFLCACVCKRESWHSLIRSSKGGQACAVTHGSELLSAYVSFSHCAAQPEVNAQLAVERNI